jgi:hypothetical protein
MLRSFVRLIQARVASAGKSVKPSLTEFSAFWAYNPVYHRVLRRHAKVAGIEIGSFGPHALRATSSGQATAGGVPKRVTRASAGRFSGKTSPPKPTIFHARCFVQANKKNACSVQIAQKVDSWEKPCLAFWPSRAFLP